MLWANGIKDCWYEVDSLQFDTLIEAKEWKYENSISLPIIEVITYENGEFEEKMCG